MYLDVLVNIPDIAGKIVRINKADSTYILYEYERKYNADKGYNVPKRVLIGRVSKDDDTKMNPNQNYKMYFPENDFPEEKSSQNRCTLLRVGTQIVLEKIIREYRLKEILGNFFFQKDLGLLLDLAVYSIITEDNVGQYYPDYAYNHFPFTEGQKIYSDSKVSDFLFSVSEDQIVGFLNEWNDINRPNDKVYISYDSTNKNCQAGDLEMSEFGHLKIDVGAPIINISVGYDTTNKIPLFYEEYPGSINDISQFRNMVGKAVGYGYKKIGFILDRGYFGKENIQYMDDNNYEFVIMAKGHASFLNSLIFEQKGKFEKKRECSIYKYGAYGTTVKAKLYADDSRERYFHIFHNIIKEGNERLNIEDKINKLTMFLEKQIGKVYAPSTAIDKYFECFIDKEGVLVAFRERAAVIEHELETCGYFVIISSEKMTAKEAIELYKSRDASEKLFSAEKTFLGGKCFRVHSNESTSAKAFIGFIALILRNKMYVSLKEETARLNKKPNYMSVPVAIKELEKIEMVRGFDNKYRVDHAVTATQKTILAAFNIGDKDVYNKIQTMSNQLETAAGKE